MELLGLDVDIGDFCSVYSFFFRSTLFVCPLLSHFHSICFYCLRYRWFQWLAFAPSFPFFSFYFCSWNNLFIFIFGSFVCPIYIHHLLHIFLTIRSHEYSSQAVKCFKNPNLDKTLQLMAIYILFVFLKCMDGYPLSYFFSQLITIHWKICVFYFELLEDDDDDVEEVEIKRLINK